MCKDSTQQLSLVYYTESCVSHFFCLSQAIQCAYSLSFSHLLVTFPGGVVAQLVEHLPTDLLIIFNVFSNPAAVTLCP